MADHRGRRIALNFRWAQPDGVLELYQAGSEGPQWWHKFPDQARGLPPRGILDRCEASATCPKVIEHFGSAEVWALKLTPEWVGTDPKNDIPLPDNVRRYYTPVPRTAVPTSQTRSTRASSGPRARVRAVLATTSAPASSRRTRCRTRRP
jgi:hypothetical protein